MELRVRRTEDGHRTLWQRFPGDRQWSQVTMPGLVANPDHRDFERRVAVYLVERNSEGLRVRYRAAESFPSESQPIRMI